MSKQNILVGASANDKSGDTLRNAFIKVNANFTELYAGGASESQLTNGAYTLTLGSTGTTTFPDGYLKIVPNGANPYISNRADNGLGLVAGSAIQIRQSVADAYGITMDCSTTDTGLGGGALLAIGSAIDVNGTKIVLGNYTVNYADANTGLTVQNKIEINNNSILIGPYSSNTVDGSTVTAFTGWTFSKNNGTLTFPDATVQYTAYQKVAVPAHSYGAAGDKAGMIAFDSTYIYYCTANYVNTSTNIWKRTAHGAGTW
jgi:hypothetical protein